MRFIAIDPGTTESALVIWQDGQIELHEKSSNAKILESLEQIHPLPETELCVEMIASYGMPVGKEVFETAVWIGRFIQCWLEHSASQSYRLVYRREVKTYLCGSMKAKDGNIRQAIIDRLGPPGTKKAPGGTYGLSGDEWQALAVALTAEYQLTLGV